MNVYPIATLAGSKQQDLAKEFVDVGHRAGGQQVLAAAGFGRP